MIILVENKYLIYRIKSVVVNIFKHIYFLSKVACFHLRFLKTLALCHTVQVAEKICTSSKNRPLGNPLDLVYNAASPDEKVSKKVSVELPRNFGEVGCHQTHRLGENRLHGQQTCTVL